jgi:hypothetical protein
MLNSPYMRKQYKMREAVEAISKEDPSFDQFDLSNICRLCHLPIVYHSIDHNPVLYNFYDINDQIEEAIEHRLSLED